MRLSLPLPDALTQARRLATGLSCTRRLRGPSSNGSRARTNGRSPLKEKQDCLPNEGRAGSHPTRIVPRGGRLHRIQAMATWGRAPNSRAESERSSFSSFAPFRLD